MVEVKTEVQYQEALKELNRLLVMLPDTLVSWKIEAYVNAIGWYESKREIARLKEDQNDWRKGVELIASALGEKDPPDLCAVRIAGVALELRARLEAKQTEVQKKVLEIAKTLKGADNESTEAPYWMIIDANEMPCLDASAVADMITGPFFSRKDAEYYMNEVRPHAYSDKACVYCCSGYESDLYEQLWKAVRREAKQELDSSGV